MTRDKIIRAWKDEDYRSSLSESELSAMPDNPAGIVQLSDAELNAAGGEEAITTITVPIAYSVLYSCAPWLCSNTVWVSTCEVPGVSAGCCVDHAL